MRGSVVENKPSGANAAESSFKELDFGTRWRLLMGKEPETRREAVAALGEVDRRRGLPWWRSEEAIQAAVWLVVWPAASVLIGDDPLSLGVVLAGAAVALVTFVFGFWLNGRRIDRMEHQAQVALRRFENLEETRRQAERYR